MSPRLPAFDHRRDAAWLMAYADDELPPVIGERYRDVLAERAIALLADWDTEPPVRACGRVADSGQLRQPKTAGGDCERNRRAI